MGRKPKEKIEEKPVVSGEAEKAGKDTKERVPDWGAKGFFRVKAVMRLTTAMLGSTPSTAKDDVTAFYRDTKGEIYLPDGYLRGALRDSAHYVGVPKTVKDVLRVSNVKHDFKGKPDLFQYTGSPSGRGVIGLYERLPVGVIIEAEFIVPKVKYDINLFKKHLEYAGKFCGLGSLRKQHGSGRFGIISVEEIK